MNNFDTSSTGLDITVTACLDPDLSRFYFEEAFFTIKEGDKELLVYCEGVLSEFEKEYSFTKAELLTAYVDHMGDKYSRADFLNDFKSNMGYGYSKACKDDLVEHIKHELYYTYEWYAFCDKAGFKGNFDIVVSSGYSQGDYKEIIVPHCFWEAIGREKPASVQSDLSDYFTNLVWDCPVYCRFTVNDEEFFIDQELKDYYSWNKAEALEIAAKLVKDSFTSEQQAIIMDFLSSALKTDLDYQ